MRQNHVGNLDKPRSAALAGNEGGLRFDPA
jgi:hypothetical protein